MQLPPLTTGRILKRYKRFFADIELEEGRVVTAHCPNTGRMTGCWKPGARAQVSHSDNPRRKLQWTLERVDMGQGWVGVNTSRTNAVVAEALALGRIAPLRGYEAIRREVRLPLEWDESSSRLDFMLHQGGRQDAYIEVKNVTLWQDGYLQFPDAVSERARRHLDALLAAVEAGCRGVILFAVNRPEGSRFCAAGAIDPDYALRLRQVHDLGVEVYARRVDHTPDGLAIGDGIEVAL